MREQITALVERHIDTIRAEAAGLERDLRALGAGGTGLSDVVRRAHTLKGSSGSLGFAQVSRAAETVEHALRALGEGRPPSGLGRAIAELRGLCAGLSARDSHIYRRFE